MTTYSKRLELLNEICANSRGPVAIKSVVNSYVAWEFMIGEHPCLTFTNNLSVMKVIINERLFPWREPKLMLEPEFSKSDWTNGEVWYRNSL